MKWLKMGFLAGAVILAPAAEAVYYSFGTITAYEGSRAVAAGYGDHGIDYPKDDVGGTLCFRDVRSGGSSAHAAVRYTYYRSGVSSGQYSAWTGNNSSTAYRCEQELRELDVSYDRAETRGSICQDDTWPAPDDCANSALRNHTIP
ncbi:hypothetical protein N801_04190 [Knoellia aerolata DSM 18566]|uniref:Secreted protein n=1 Tax=Knoellia aerolata DSM 18566 TaxID=1385519 RepID=A0A0A0JWR0_9MICO|nr:hypothetical protein N801_04190 [Knoellia aerolata DSM 18566]